MKKILIALITLSATVTLYGQSNFWNNSTALELSDRYELNLYSKYKLHGLQTELLVAKLSSAPTGRSNYQEDFHIALPFPDGSMHLFAIVSTPIVGEYNQQDWQGMQTYSAYALDNKLITAKIDLTPAGFHAMVFTPSGLYFIDPIGRNWKNDVYISYYKKDYAKPEDKTFVCWGAEGKPIDPGLNGEGLFMAQGDCQLRTYRLAIAATGEYTSFHGGQAGAQAAIITTMNRVNGVFERDLGVTMTIVSGTNIIYTNSGTDPYSNNNGGTMLGENQSNLDAVIGSGNYDIGHVFSTGGGGVAMLNSPCNNSTKAQGVTGSSSPVGDPFDIDYVAHEMGHQFGANHTFNATSGSCCCGNRNAGTAMEPGSASSIMGYAGICGSNVQSNSDALFHAVSITEMSANVISGTSNSCPVITSTSGNNAPVANAGGNYTIPVSTPFQLTGSATDADGDPVTYSWEQYNAGTAAETPSATATSGPNFRTFLPTTNPTRYFPNLAAILANTQWPTWEVIPSVTRTMDFRLTVRDNNGGGYGCTDIDNMQVTFDGGSGPFVVTYPNAAGITWTGGTSETVTWNVAGTDNAPVSCANVDILLSTDGGATFPYTLASAVTNDGSQAVTVPNLPTTTARIKVICNGNIFFDISNNDFEIVATPSTDPEISFATVSTSASENNAPDGNNDCRPYKDYVITMQIINPPTGDAVVTPVIDSATADTLYDYIVLNAPLTFANGSTTSQSFTIRVFDEAIIEGTENIYISYNISGTTNAIKGLLNQTHTVTITDNDLSPTAGGAPTTIWSENWTGGSGTTYPAGWTAVQPAAGNRNLWYIFNATCPGVINGNTAFIVNDNGGLTCGYDAHNQSPIYLYRQVDATGLSGVTVDFNWKGDGDAGNDFGELIYATNIAGPWTSVATYNGQTTTQAASVTLPATLDNSIFYIGWRFTNNTDGTVWNPGFAIDDIVVQGTPGVAIETVKMTNSDNQYLGPNQSVYFYNPTDGDLMVKIDNTSAHDYGCTTVQVDRQGSGASPFQSSTVDYDVTDKSFRIVPTNNNLSGAYDITLYYKEAEIAGWETATGRLRSEIQVVKTQDSISGVTPGNPLTSVTFYSATNSRGTFGSDFWLKGSFTNGFSGFAGGIDGSSTLALNQILLTGTKQKHTTHLHWNTSNLPNVKLFEIERSAGHSGFKGLGTIYPKTIENEFNFVDSDPKGGINFYRIKVVLSNDKVYYSNTTSVNFEDLKTNVTVMPVPFDDLLTVNLNQYDGFVQYRIENILGQALVNGNFEVSDDLTQFKINTTGLSHGTYLLIIENQKERVVRKVIK